MRTLQYVLGILCFVALGISAVYQQVQVYRVGYDISTTLDEVTELEESSRLLRQEISEKSAPGRLAAQAVALELSLLPPDEVGAPAGN